MKFCPECGSRLTEKAKFCSNCGYSLLEMQQVSIVPQNVNTTRPENAESVADSSPSNIPRIPRPGTAVSSIDPTPKKKNGFVRIGVPIIAAVLLLSMCGKSNSSTSPATASPKPTQTPTPAPTATIAPVEKKQDPIHVFYVDLADNVDDYDGKLIETTMPVGYINSSGDIEIRDRISRKIIVKTSDKSYYDGKDGISYITVKGIVKNGSSDIQISNPTISYAGKVAPDDYTAEIAEYVELVKTARIAAREEFIANTETPTWNDLSRYPDTYKGKPIALSVYITDVESDGLLSNGTVTAYLNGQEIKIYDHRTLREPRLAAGDSITIYGEGSGTTTIKTIIQGSGILGSNLGAEVVDTRDVPAVSMIYTSADNLEKFGSIIASDDDIYYRKGAELTDKTNDTIADLNK